MKKFVWAAVVAALGVSAVQAEFEGVIRMKMTSAGATGNIQIYASKAGMRNEMEMRAEKGPAAMKMVTLVRTDKPDTAYQINDAAKTYAEIDLKEAKEKAGKADAKVSVKKLGRETVAGYDCAHVLVTSAGAETELWTSKDILDYKSFAKVAGPKSGVSDSYYQALKGAGADGFVVKSLHRAKGEVATMELVGVEKKSLSPSLFEVPAGYAKQSSMGMNMMPPDAQKNMREQMKNMPKEQREMMEKMMKQRGGK